MAAMLERLIEDYADRAYQFAYHLCGNVDEAQDVVQEAFLKAIRGWEAFDESQDFWNWFLAILRNIHCDRRRRYERRNCVSLDVPIEGGGEEAETFADTLADGDAGCLLERLTREQGQQEVRDAFDSLGEEARAVLTLCDIQGLSYEEIAEVLAVPVGTVRSRLARARGFLRRELAERAAAEEALNK